MTMRVPHPRPFCSCSLAKALVSLILPASIEPQVVICRAFAGETRKEEAHVDVDVDVLSHGNALTAGAHPGNIKSGLLKKYGHLVSIPSKECPLFALLCLSSADSRPQMLSHVSRTSTNTHIKAC
ncbi:uncharacterized protein TrAtP1_003979 [Trichoderma atroviride]|uniref:uncharacterized protein n=1 Tax=Hypocrea atroviridis TaxID=63577 RepID=UPI0033205C55|nr:hypothetical protein TrAtP1_003979 [Trichoderma atroviride]